MQKYLCNRAMQLMVAIAFGSVAFAAHADTLTGRVVGVADGDTITVLDADRQQHKIRLGGIDAPEKAQPFGQRSKENLSRMVFGKEVRVDGKSVTATAASSARCGFSRPTAQRAQ